MNKKFNNSVNRLDGELRRFKASREIKYRLGFFKAAEDDVGYAADKGKNVFCTLAIFRSDGHAVGGEDVRYLAIKIVCESGACSRVKTAERGDLDCAVLFCPLHFYGVVVG